MTQNVFAGACLALLLLAAPALPASAATAGVTLAADGHTAYRIEVKGASAPVMDKAAHELAEYLQRISGARFPVESRDGGGPVIRIHARPAQRKQPGEDEGFTIRTDGQNLLIDGESPRGAAYGVYYFLEHYLGVRWLASDFTVVPRRANIKLAPINVSQRPAFSYREVFSRDADDPDFALHNRLNGQFGHRVIEHKLGTAQGGSASVRSLSIFDLVPRDRYARSHPEYYGGGQLRFANPQVREVALENLKKKLAKWPADQPYYLLVQHADRETYYNGGGDAELIRRGGAPGAAFVEFVRYLANGVRNQHANVTLLLEAYLWSRKPPRAMPLPDNLGVMLSDIEVNFAEPLEAPGNRPFLQDLEGWSQLTNKIIIWHYITDFNNYLQPFPDFDALGKDLKTLAGHAAVKGIFAEGSYSTKGGEFALLRAWLLARLMWSPESDQNALMRSFCEAYFGPAAPYILDYIATLQRSAREHDAQLSTKTPPSAAYLSLDFLRTADQLFMQAAAAVADQPVYLKHVQTARMPVDYAILINRPRLKYQASQQGGQWRSDPERLKRLERAMHQAGMTRFREGGDASPDNLIAILSIERTPAPPPRGCSHEGGGTRCGVVQADSFKLAGSAHMVADPAASDGAAAAMTATDTSWGIQIPLERLIPGPGKWKLHARARAAGESVKPGQGVLQVGVYPGEHRTVHLDGADGTAYQDVPIPGTWQRDDRRYVWIAGSPSAVGGKIYIDRVVAVPAP